MGHELVERGLSWPFEESPGGMSGDNVPLLPAARDIAQ
jgi:hypothetical protein